MKLAMMVDQGKVDGAARNGCWATCHMDARDMPNAPAGKTVTKYVAESRTQLDTAKRDNWDKLKPQAEIDALLAGGTFMDLTRFLSSGASEQGYVLAERVLNPAKGVAYTGTKDGDKWVVTMVRRLKATQPGEVTFEPGKTYAVGFAIHDDYTQGRFHHVSVDMQLGLGAEGDIKAGKI
jgi:cytochrome c-type protein NapC